MDCSNEAISIGLKTLSSNWPHAPATVTPVWLPITCEFIDQVSIVRELQSDCIPFSTVSHPGFQTPLATKRSLANCPPLLRSRITWPIKYCKVLSTCDAWAYTMEEKACRYERAPRLQLTHISEDDRPDLRRVSSSGVVDSMRGFEEFVISLWPLYRAPVEGGGNRPVPQPW